MVLASDATHEEGHLNLTRLSLINALLAAGAFVATDTVAADWPSAGANLKNSRYQQDNNITAKSISAKTVGSLQLKWTFTTDGDVTANPTVDGKYLYFPDSVGSLYKLEKDTGKLVWKRSISAYTTVTNDYARASPAVAGNLLILGNQAGKSFGFPGQPVPSPARVFAVDKNTGNLVWSTQVDPSS